jgi:hypothetical protein
MMMSPSQPPPSSSLQDAPSIEECNTSLSHSQKEEIHDELEKLDNAIGNLLLQSPTSEKSGKEVLKDNKRSFSFKKLLQRRRSMKFVINTKERVEHATQYSEDETPNLESRDDNGVNVEDQIEAVKTVVKCRDILSQTNFQPDEEVEVFLKPHKCSKELIPRISRYNPYLKPRIASFKIENVYNSFRTQTEVRTNFQFAVFLWLLKNGTAVYAKNLTERRSSMSTRKDSLKEQEKSFLPTEQDILHAGLKVFKRSVGTACRSFKTNNKKEAVESKNMLFSMLEKLAMSQSTTEALTELSSNESAKEKTHGDIELVNALVLYCKPPEEMDLESRTKDSSKPEEVQPTEEAVTRNNDENLGQIQSQNEALEPSLKHSEKKEDDLFDENVVTKDKTQEAFGCTENIEMALDYIWSISDLWCSREQCALRTENVTANDSNSAEHNTETSIVKFEHSAKSMGRNQTNELQDNEEISSTKFDCNLFDALCSFMRLSPHQSVPAVERNPGTDNKTPQSLAVEMSTALVLYTKKEERSLNKMLEVMQSTNPSEKIVSDEKAAGGKASKNQPTETVEKSNASINVTVKHATVSNCHVSMISHCNEDMNLHEDSKDPTSTMKLASTDEPQEKIFESTEKKSLKELSKDQHFTIMTSAPKGKQDTLDENSTIVKESKNDGPSLNMSTQMQCDRNDTPIMLRKTQTELKALIDIIDSIDEELNNMPTEWEGKALDKIQRSKVQKTPKQKITQQNKTCASSETPPKACQRKVSKKKKQKQISLRQRSSQRSNSINVGLGTILEASEDMEQDMSISSNESEEDEKVMTGKEQLVTHKEKQSDSFLGEPDTKVASINVDRGLEPDNQLEEEKIQLPTQLFRKTRSAPLSSTSPHSFSQLYISGYHKAHIDGKQKVHIDQHSGHSLLSSWTTNSSASIDSISNKEDGDEYDISIDDKKTDNLSSAPSEPSYDSRDDTGDIVHYLFQDNDESNSSFSQGDDDDGASTDDDADRLEEEQTSICKYNDISSSNQALSKDTDVLQLEIMLNKYQAGMSEEMKEGKKKRSWSFLPRKRSQQRQQKRKEEEKVDLRDGI